MCPSARLFVRPLRPRLSQFPTCSPWTPRLVPPLEKRVSQSHGRQRERARVPTRGHCTGSHLLSSFMNLVACGIALLHSWQRGHDDGGVGNAIGGSRWSWRWACGRTMGLYRRHKFARPLFLCCQIRRKRLSSLFFFLSFIRVITVYSVRSFPADRVGCWLFCEPLINPPSRNRALLLAASGPHLAACLCQCLEDPCFFFFIPPRLHGTRMTSYTPSSLPSISV